MKPLADHGLMTFAVRFMEKVAPEITSEYWQKDTVVMASLMMVAAEDYEKAADIRVRENRELRALFGRTDVTDTVLAARLQSAASGTEDSYLISALQAQNESLKALLIDLHAYADDQDPDLSKTLWLLLNKMAEGRTTKLMG